jgi:predicted ATP-dependent serine protease
MSNKGWECPICGAVMAPFKGHCINCSGKTMREKTEAEWSNDDINKARNLLCESLFLFESPHTTECRDELADQIRKFCRIDEELE